MADDRTGYILLEERSGEVAIADFREPGRSDRTGGMPGAKIASLPVTVVVPVRNEEVNLPRCLERLSRFPEVVVVDSASTDRTRAIAEAMGARVVCFEWNGTYPKKRNWFLLNHRVTQPWVLFLDADEFVDDAFCDDLERTLPGSACDGYWISYTNHFLGRALKHGVPQRKLALFRVGRALYERIEEDQWSALDMEIHEHPIVEGAVGTIGTPIDHRDYKGLAKFIERHKDYALWEARRVRSVRGDPEIWSRFTWRQRVKYRHIARWWYPWFYFLATYVGRLGFLDGAAGFHYAMYKAWYFQTIRLLIREQPG